MKKYFETLDSYYAATRNILLLFFFHGSLQLVMQGNKYMQNQPHFCDKFIIFVFLRELGIWIQLSHPTV